MEITEMDQDVAVSYRYSPYGDPTITRNGQPEATDPLGQHWAFTGRYYDDEASAYYYRARSLQHVARYVANFQMRMQCRQLRAQGFERRGPPAGENECAGVRREGACERYSQPPGSAGDDRSMARHAADAARVSRAMPLNISAYNLYMSRATSVTAA